MGKVVDDGISFEPAILIDVRYFGTNKRPQMLVAFEGLALLQAVCLPQIFLTRKDIVPPATYLTCSRQVDGIEKAEDAFDELLGKVINAQLSATGQILLICLGTS